MDKDEIEEANHHFVENWSGIVDLEYSGVDLVDCIQYPLLQVIGRVWVQELAEEAND